MWTTTKSTCPCSDSALRNVVRIYPYDVAPNVDTTGDGVADEGSLRGSSEVVAKRIQDEIQKNVTAAGIRSSKPASLGLRPRDRGGHAATSAGKRHH